MDANLEGTLLTSEKTEETQGRLRRLHVDLVSGAVSAVGALLVAVNATAWQDALLMAVSLAVTLLVVSRWHVGRLSRAAFAGLVVTAALWLLGMLLVDVSMPAYGFAIVATVIILDLPRHQWAATAGIAAFAVAGLTAKLVVSRDGVVDFLLQHVVASAGVALGGVVLTILAHAIHGLVSELAAAREREAELAVAQERMRFASDLHDIQGHTLHVVKLKTALARKLVRADPDRAEEELGEIQTLVGETITQTRELAHAQRRLNLSAELENAKNLFEAAGIDVRVDRGAEAAPGAGELLGQVLRETTTNILRHAQAARVRITLTETGISIVNDGASQEPPARLRGLAALRERVADSGGELTVHHDQGRFTTAAEFPHLTSVPGPENTARGRALRPGSTR
ncbi:sensor histidine kinase [Nocardiopsis alborubida]|uniref:Sensor histidine kinase n=1 Tax=Nocardiopsis alborubida TaxID=146802 RepID=A0A7X6RR30_9ACTN|nr:histidine kinase [Nocardiopsis alborubida]NKY98857.1 sensor histidine kinase [Nocardiopsis alborubida]